MANDSIRETRVSISDRSSALRGPRIVAVCLWPVLLCWSSGCASAIYEYGRFHPNRPGGADVQPIAIQHGTPNEKLDKISYVIGFPARLLTLNKNVNNHNISPETLDKLRRYLEENDITDVYVAIDRYEPKDQWRRLRENDRISPFWRYSVGAITCLGYTVLPNRVFGGDRYNPFTNTLNLSSDVPAMVLAEAAYAKNIHGQQFPGAYASIVNDLPVLTVWRQARATSDVVTYSRIQRDWETEKSAYCVMYPQLGVGCIGPAGTFIPVVGPFMDLGGAVAGHVAGRTVAAIEESRRPKAAPAAPGEPEAPGPLGPGNAPDVPGTLGKVQIADAKEVPSPQDGRSSKPGNAVVPASYEK